jgi:outer membrane protein TolC
VLLFSALAAAASTASTPATLSLDQLIAHAVEHHADVSEGRWRVQTARAQLRQAKAAYVLPRLRFEGETGLIPDAKGDVFSPPSDTTGLRSLGPFTRGQLEFVQPLYTFGQISSLKRAARHAVAVEQADLGGVRVGLARQVKEAYYAVLLAQSLSRLVAQVRSAIDDQLAMVDPEVVLSLADHYKLRLALVTLDAQAEKAARQLQLARSALAWQAGYRPDTTLALADTVLQPLSVDLPPLEALVDQAFDTRPDWRQLQAGIAARSAEEDAARRAYLPQIYLAGGLRYAVAPGRTDQHNPFVVDNYNYLSTGAYIGFRQSLEWGMLGAEVDRAHAEYRALRSKEDGALTALRMDVERSRSEYVEAREAMATAAELRRLARQWLQEALDEYDFDPETLDDLVSAFQTYATLEQQYQEAVFDNNVALADLEQTLGLVSLQSSVQADSPVRRSGTPDRH